MVPYVFRLWGLIADVSSVSPLLEQTNSTKARWIRAFR